MTLMESYVERPPWPGLAGVVRTVWIQRTGEAPYVQRHLPTGGVEIHFPIGGHPQLVGPLTGPEVEVIPAHTTGPDSRKARNLRRDPRMALSIAPADNPFQPVVIRGRVVEWLEGDAAWEIIDQLATKYTGAPYSRGQERVVAVIEPERQTVGVR
jgi:hypothetical protein